MNPLASTPNLDKLSASGISFSHAYCTSPICSASRQSKLTGKYPEIVEQLRQKMFEEFRRTHPDVAKEPEKLNNIGNLVWYCEPRDIGAEFGGTPLRVME